MEIRTAADADREGIAGLIRQLYPGFDGHPALPRVRQESRTFVAEADGIPTGTIVV